MTSKKTKKTEEFLPLNLDNLPALLGARETSCVGIPERRFRLAIGEGAKWEELCITTPALRKSTDKRCRINDMQAIYATFSFNTGYRYNTTLTR